MENNSLFAVPDEIREQIVQAARKVFARYGYKKTALDNIANEAHRGKSTIYYYFKSKDEIFKAVIDAEAEIRKQTIEEQINQISDPKQKLRTYINVRMRALKMVVNYYEAIKNELLDRLYFVDNLRVEHFEAEIRQINQMLFEGIASGDYTIKNPELTAKTIVTALHGFEVPIIVKNLSDEELEKGIDEMLNILFYGIVSKK
jgi:AcrR family transcriptional regulator